jgi:large subunit ribosomal protein L20
VVSFQPKILFGIFAMVRSGSGKTQALRRKRLRKLTKGFRLSRHNLFRQSLTTLIRGRVYAFRDRKAKKRQYRRLWIIRINAACRMRDMRYSELIAGLQRACCMLDRKSLSEIAIHDPATFDKIVELARKHMPKQGKPKA